MAQVKFKNRILHTIAILLFIVLSCCCRAQTSRKKYQLNDPCTTRYNASGNCKYINDCVHEYEDITIFKRKPLRCSQYGTEMLRCCLPMPTHVPVTPAHSHLPIAFPLSEGKCRGYMQYSQFINEKNETTAGCPRGKTGMIYGGEPAKPLEFPHMALLRYKTRKSGYVWDCGGSLISENFVLTAAHCIMPHFVPVQVRLGDLDIADDAELAAPQTINIANIIVHPEYDATQSANDIALLRLEHAAILSPYVFPICLPQQFEPHTAEVTATGWGMTERLQKSTKLLKVDLVVFNHSVCFEQYDELPAHVKVHLPNSIQEEMHICAGSNEAGKDTCQGDSGGPIQVFDQNNHCMYKLIGLTSFGLECGTAGVPAVYVRVFNYMPWIEQNVWPD